ncbi:MAG: hypothetical protein HKO56_09585 [Bacteroidia bacterium]|nr:hypothetical protein [Bacteroidia bacterium]NNC85177.1 hypothetical protein [Bacteroidia bacterium]NNM16897.1 hypothetical protein [Bacteroidia bacterium]
MTKRDFFIAAIRIFGLLSIVTSVFTTIPSSISYMFMHIDAYSIVWLTLVIVILVGLFVLLIFKSGSVVNLLKLDKGFDDDRIDFGNLSSSDIVKFATFIIGGFLIIENISPFLNHIFFAFKGTVSGESYQKPEYFQWAICSLNLIVGYLLITNYSFVAKLFGNRNPN